MNVVNVPGSHRPPPPVSVPAPDRLCEVLRTRQAADGLRRRWYAGTSADLYVWLRGTRIRAFEFTFDKPRAERAVRWDVADGLAHYWIDDGEQGPWNNRSPIARRAGAADLAAVALTFEAVAGDVDPPIYRFILGKLHEIL